MFLSAWIAWAYGSAMPTMLPSSAVAVVPDTIGTLVKGDTLVSNFNDKANVQGTGTTIVQLSPAGTRSTFATLGPLPAPRL